MSHRKIKDLEARRKRQALTAGLTKKERQSWGSNGRQLTKRNKPKGYFSVTDKK